MTKDSLHPIDRVRLDHVSSLFRAPRPVGIEAVIYCLPLMGTDAIAVFICKKPDASFAVIVHSISFHAIVENQPEIPKASEAPLEIQLADRIIALIQFELKRTSPKATADYIVMDGTNYYFMGPSAKSSTLLGTTDGGYPDSTVERLTRTVEMLGGLVRTDESDRTQLLGEIDRAVTAIEVAYKLAR